MRSNAEHARSQEACCCSRSRLSSPRSRRPAPVLEARGRARLPGGRALGRGGRLGGSPAARPPPAAARRRGAGRLVPGAGLPRRAVRRHRQRRQGAARRRHGGLGPLRRARARVHALAVGPDGRVYAATSPDGKVYAIDAAGKAEVFYDPSDRYIWALAFDREGALFVATGARGPGAPRATRRARARRLHEQRDPRALARRRREGQRLRRHRARRHRVPDRSALKVFAVFDSPYREVKALAIGADGSLYAAVVDGRGPETTPRPPAPPPQSCWPARPWRRGHCQRERDDGGTTGTAHGRRAAGSRPAAAREGRAAADPCLGRRRHALELSRRRAVLRRLDGRRRPRRHGQPRQGLPRVGRRTLGARRHAAGGAGDRNRPHRGRGGRARDREPGARASLEREASERGRFVSNVKDAASLASWGRLSWEGDAPAGTSVRLETRLGNTATPDATWTEWTATPASGLAPSERARFLQLRLLLTGSARATPSVEAVSAAYLQRNLPPVLRPITVHPPGEAFQKPISASGELEILGLDVDPLSERAAGSAGRRARRRPSASAASSTSTGCAPSRGRPTTRTATRCSTTSRTGRSATTAGGRCARASPSPSSPGTRRRSRAAATRSA